MTGPAYTFGPGPHTYAATATDRAGNTGNGSMTFTVVVTGTDLCKLTTQFVQSSARYQALAPPHRASADAHTDMLGDRLEMILHSHAPKQRAVFLEIYEKGVQKLVKLDWLTPSQAQTLVSLADAM